MIEAVTAWIATFVLAPICELAALPARASQPMGDVYPEDGACACRTRSVALHRLCIAIWLAIGAIACALMGGWLWVGTVLFVILLLQKLPIIYYDRSDLR